MSNFTIHNVESAPEKSKAQLEESVASFGMIPNLHGVMAESPALLEGYKTLHRLFSEETAFNAEELTVIWQTINVENACHYCVPAHTAIAYSMKINPEVIEALRNELPLADEKLQTLRNTTLSIVRNRGNLTEQELADFYSTGYEKRHLLEVLLGYSQKILSNYANHLAETPVDAPFQQFEWKKEQV